jgi:3,4-dihydroxy-2-butanone 4-phosphate synthase
MGHTETVRALAACGADVHTANETGDTPVHVAAGQGHTETVQALVKCGADAKAADQEGRTPVWVAARAGHTETVRALAECGADPKTADNVGRTPVWVAAREGHTATVRALAACFADVSTADQEGRTPVWVAARAGHTETVLALVQQCGADPFPALVWVAARAGHTETVRALVQQCGADPFPALRDAARLDNAEMIWTLVRECGVNPAGLSRAGKKARDLAPPGSRACGLLGWLEELQEPEHALAPEAQAARAAQEVANAAKRDAEFECPLCLEKRHAVALVPCGHRMCPECWATMRGLGLRSCPFCRAPTLTGAPQDSWPDRHPLYSRFCVEVPTRRVPGAYCASSLQ